MDLHCSVVSLLDVSYRIVYYLPEFELGNTCLHVLVDNAIISSSKCLCCKIVLKRDRCTLLIVRRRLKQTSAERYLFKLFSIPQISLHLLLCRDSLLCQLKINLESTFGRRDWDNGSWRAGLGKLGFVLICHEVVLMKPAFNVQYGCLSWWTLVR